MRSCCQYALHPNKRSDLQDLPLLIDHWMEGLTVTFATTGVSLVSFISTQSQLISRPASANAAARSAVRLPAYACAVVLGSITTNETRGLTKGLNRAMADAMLVLLVPSLLLVGAGAGRSAGGAGGTAGLGATGGTAGALPAKNNQCSNETQEAEVLYMRASDCRRKVALTTCVFWCA